MAQDTKAPVCQMMYLFLSVPHSLLVHSSVHFSTTDSISITCVSSFLLIAKFFKMLLYIIIALYKYLVQLSDHQLIIFADFQFVFSIPKQNGLRVQYFK